MIDANPRVVEVSPEAPATPLRSKDGFYLLVLLIVAFLVRLAWAWLIPYNEGPDEGSAHILLIEFYLKHFRLPELPEILSNEAGAYGAMSPLPYLLHSFFGLFADKAMPLAQQILVPRLGSVVAGTAVVWAAFVGCRKYFPNNRLLQWSIPLFLTFQPQLVFVSAYLNADVVSILVSTLLIAFWPELLKTGLTWRNMLYLGLLGGLLALCKLNALALVPPTLMVVTMAWARFRMPLATVALRGIGAAGLSLALSAWFYIRNHLALGDMLGYRSMWEVAKRYLNKNPSPIESGISFKGAILDMPWREQTFQSSWGVYSWMTAFHDARVYAVLGVVCGVALLGVAWLLVRRRSIDNLTPGLVISMLIAFALALALMAWTSYANDWQPQGRYHFPVIFGEAILLHAGLMALMPWRQVQRGVAVMSVLGMMAMSSYAYFFMLWPMYRP